MKHISFSILIGLLLTLITYRLSLVIGWISEINEWEFLAVVTQYACVYLCVIQSRLNYPVGAISVALFSVVFWQAELYASMALNIYLLPVLVYGWFRWGRDDTTRPVTNLLSDSPKWAIGYVAITALTYVGVLLVLDYFDASLPVWDTAILVLSILAQFLLDNKRRETWYVWGIVNVIAIYVYSTSGLYMLSFQFALLLANTIWGWYKWQPQKS